MQYPFCQTENEFPKNANIIASCVIHQLSQENLYDIKHIRLAQMDVPLKKNSILILALCKWMTSEYVINVDGIEMVFPVTGHSHLPHDRVFATIEKKVKQLYIILLSEEYLKIIHQVRVRRTSTEKSLPACVAPTIQQEGESCMVWAA